MNNNLKECPFCGCEEVTVVARYIKKYTSWSGTVTYNHCCASGSHCGGEESEADAERAAIINWNSACRPNRFKMSIIRKWNTFWRMVNGEY